MPEQSAPITAFDLSGCPYFKDPDHGKCESGCYSEPRCVTDEPLDGWPSQRSHEPLGPDIPDGLRP